METRRAERVEGVGSCNWIKRGRSRMRLPKREMMLWLVDRDGIKKETTADASLDYV